MSLLIECPKCGKTQALPATGGASRCCSCGESVDHAVMVRRPIVDLPQGTGRSVLDEEETRCRRAPGPMTLLRSDLKSRDEEAKSGWFGSVLSVFGNKRSEDAPARPKARPAHEQAAGTSIPQKAPPTSSTTPLIQQRQETTVATASAPTQSPAANDSPEPSPSPLTSSAGVRHAADLRSSAISATTVTPAQDDAETNVTPAKAAEPAGTAQVDTGPVQEPSPVCHARHKPDFNRLQTDTLATPPAEVPSSRPARSSSYPSSPSKLGRASRRESKNKDVILAEGKPSDALLSLLKTRIESGMDCLAIRVSPGQAAVVRASFAQARYNHTGRTLRISAAEESTPVGKVIIVVADTGDHAVAEEAVETAKWLGCEAQLLSDDALLSADGNRNFQREIDNADAFVVVVGADGALPSLVAHDVGCPVIAIPTSTASAPGLCGIGSLLGLLTYSAANVTVVNIDSGYRGAYAACAIARRRARRFV